MLKNGWNKVANRSLPNLHVLSRDGREVGFIYKPNDTKGDKNAWRSHSGIGDNNVFLGHVWSKADAQEKVEGAI